MGIRYLNGFFPLGERVSVSLTGFFLCARYRVMVIAISYIKPWQEVFLSYGCDYWRHGPTN